MPANWVTVADAREAWSQDPSVVTRCAALSEAAAAILARPHGRNAYVVDEAGLLVGVVSFRSLLRAADARLAGPGGGLAFLGAWRELLADRVEDVMRAPETVKVNTRIVEAFTLLRKSGQSDLPIVDDGGKLVGEINGLQVLAVAMDVLRASEERVARAHALPDGASR